MPPLTRYLAEYIPAAAGGTTLSPSGLTRTRALGAPHVNPGLKPAGQTHTRAQGAPKVNPKLAPAALAHTRAQGTITVTAGFFVSPASLAHTRAQGALKVSPQLRPASLTHTRALGTTTVTIPTVRQLGGLTVTVAWIPRPAGLAHARAQGSLTAHGRAAITPDPLVRSRTQGAPKLSARTTPNGLQHTRTLGQPLVNPIRPIGLTRNGIHPGLDLYPDPGAYPSDPVRALGALTASIAWTPRLTGLQHTRGQSTPTVRGFQTLGPSSLTRTRGQGTPVLSGRALPASLVHTRAQGAPAVNVRQLAPLALSRA